MATQHDNTRFSDLKARLAALNCELLEEEGSHAERYVIFSKAKGLIVSNGATIQDQYDWAETEEDVRDDTREVETQRSAATGSDTHADRTKLITIMDELSDALRYANGALAVFATHDDLEEYQQDAVGAILERLRGAAKLIDDLNEWRNGIPSLAETPRTQGDDEPSIAEQTLGHCPHCGRS